MIEITVNGESQTAPEGQTILGLIRQLELDPARLAVELERRIVKQSLWPETVLHPGAQLEIVQFVGGG
jgi:thiamine biosynthesis protein ThiS